MARTGFLNKAMPAGPAAGSGSAIERAAQLAAKVAGERLEDMTENRADLEKCLRDKQDAQDRMDNAEIEEDYLAAEKDRALARIRERRLRKLIDDYMYSPRMDGAVYDETVKAVEMEIREAADHFREVAGKAIAEIMAAREELYKKASAADEALEALDKAGNVMQSRHRYREITYVDREPDRIEDASEWLNHIVRYARGAAGRQPAAYNLALYGDLEGRAPVDSAARAAWQAAELAKR